MIRRILSLVVTLAGMSLAAQAAAQEVLFTYAFEAGSSHRYRVKMNQEMDYGGNAMGQIADFEVTVACESVTDGKAAMVMTFEKADMSRDVFGNLATDPLAETIVGKKVAYTVDASGEVTDIKQSGYYEGWDQMRPFVEPLIKSWYVPMPGKAYAPGGEWSQTKKDTGAGGTDVTSTSRYKFKETRKEHGRDCAAVVGEVTSQVAGQSVNPMGTFNVQGEGDGKFEFLFDPASRMIVRLKAKMNVDMDLTPAVGGDTIDAAVTYQMERELL